MVARSTGIILVGIVLLFWPVPSLITTVLGVVVIILGATVRILDN